MQAPLDIVVVQRQTVDWNNLTDEEFQAQSRDFCALWGKPPDYVWNFFILWNRTFGMDYRVVRQKLKDISRQNCQQAQAVTFVPYQQYRNIPEKRAYYIFLDDDDWIDPLISSHLQEQLENYPELPSLLLWRSANIGSPNQEHVVFVWGMNGRCMTNNYAVHQSLLKPFSMIDQFLQHKDAAAVIEKQSGIPHLDCALTISNKSPISSVSLDRGLDGDLSPSRLVTLVESYLERMRRVEDRELVYMPWSRPLLQKTIHLFEQVLSSRR